MKNDNSSSADNNKTSLLPKNVQTILQRNMTKGFRNGYLNLSSKLVNCFILSFNLNLYKNENRNINDSIMSEICEWLIKIEGKVETLE